MLELLYHPVNDLVLDLDQFGFQAQAEVISQLDLGLQRNLGFKDQGFILDDFDSWSAEALKLFCFDGFSASMGQHFI